MWGDIASASRTLQKYHSVWRHFGFIPEFYQIASGEPYSGRAGYPLRPGGCTMVIHKKNVYNKKHTDANYVQSVINAKYK